MSGSFHFLFFGQSDQKTKKSADYRKNYRNATKCEWGKFRQVQVSQFDFIDHFETTEGISSQIAYSSRKKNEFDKLQAGEGVTFHCLKWQYAKICIRYRKHGSNSFSYVMNSVCLCVHHVILSFEIGRILNVFVLFLVQPIFAFCGPFKLFEPLSLLSLYFFQIQFQAAEN